MRHEYAPEEEGGDDFPLSFKRDVSVWATVGNTDEETPCPQRDLTETLPRRNRDYVPEDSHRSPNKGLGTKIEEDPDVLLTRGTPSHSPTCGNLL